MYAGGECNIQYARISEIPVLGIIQRLAKLFNLENNQYMNVQKPFIKRYWSATIDLCEVPSHKDTMP